MSEKVKITCVKCQSIWEKRLQESENLETVFRGEKEKPKEKVVEYRAVCPVCSTYNIIKVQED